MPWPAPVIPRQMLPPPTTTAMSTSRSRRTSTISCASWRTMSPSMPWPSLPANASPESLRTTRRHRAPPTVDRPSAADRDLGEAHDLRAAEEVGDRLLLVLHVVLLEEHALLEPAGEATVDDLAERGLGLALGAGDVLERRPLLGHLGLGHVVAAEVRGAGERDLDGDLVREVRAAAGQLDEHAVHAAPVLAVDVGVDDVAVGRLAPHDLAERDVLLEDDLEVVDRVGLLGGRLLALRRDERGDLLDERRELVGLGDEVGLALELGDRSDVVGGGHRNRALRVLPALPGRGLREALLPQPLRSSGGVAAVLGQGALRVHHPGAGRLAQLLDVLGSEVSHAQLSVVASAGTSVAPGVASTASATSACSVAGSAAGAGSVIGVSSTGGGGGIFGAVLPAATRASRSAAWAAAWRRASACSAAMRDSSSAERTVGPAPLPPRLEAMSRPS